MKKIALFILFCCCVMRVFAEDAPAVSGSSELFLQLSSEPAAKLGFIQRYYVPFLQGEGPLTAGNNITFALGVDMSPVSFSTFAEAVWTPIAFFQLTAGGRAGSGWNLSLFGSEIYGIGLNYANSEGKSEHSGSAFDGLLFKAQAGAVLQMDLAALYPGDWHHVIVRTYHEINEKGYTRAKAGESWYFENDFGENCNGLNYYGNLLLGYQLPVFLNMVALLAEADLYLYDTPGRSLWGDDKIRWTFSGILGFKVTKQFSTALITQFRTMRNFTKDTKELYYRNRELNTSDPLRLEFFRVAAVVTYTLTP